MMTDELLRSGLDQHRAGDLDRAETLFRRAVAQAPDDPRALYLLGLLRFERGDPAEALGRLEQVAGLRPGHAQSWLSLAQLRQWSNDEAGAAEAYQQVVALEPGHAGALIGLAQTRLALGDYGRALSAAHAAIAAAPEQASGYQAQGAALAAMGQAQAAAGAFEIAVALAPQSSAAHLGLAVERLRLSQPGPAAASAVRASALDPDCALAWRTLGCAYRALGQPAQVIEALTRAIAIEPENAADHRALGLAHAELDQMAAAERRLLRAISLDPSDVDSLASLSSLYCGADRLEAGRHHALRALELDPGHATAHQNLARILGRAGNEDEARRHRDLAYGACSLYRIAAPRPRQTVLVLATTDTGNTPERYLLPASQYTRLVWFIEYATEAELSAPPEHDVVFNAIGDQDEAGPTSQKVARFLAGERGPVFNAPNAIARTSRHLAPEVLGDIEGLAVPAVARLDLASLARFGLIEAARRAGLTAPMIVRPVGSHGGKGLALVGADDAPRAGPHPALIAERDHYVTAFHDFRAPDGLYRKYRMIFVDRQPLPYHLAVGDHWLVHYENSGTAGDPARLAEERRFLEAPDAVLGPRAMAAVRAVGERLDLDFCGIDFSLLPDGRVLLFEANATMLVHPEDPDGPLAHKNAAVEQVFEAFRTMLARPQRARAAAPGAAA